MAKKTIKNRIKKVMNQASANTDLVRAYGSEAISQARRAGSSIKNEIVTNAGEVKKIGKAIYNSKGKGLGKNLLKLAKNPLVGLSLFAGGTIAGSIARNKRKNKKSS